jgi:antitoxin VapB
MARKVADKRGLSLTGAVREALREKLEREVPRPLAEWRMAKIREIVERSSKRPTLDPRTPDEIIGYDEIGVPR